MKETFKKRPVKSEQPRRAKSPVAPERFFLGVVRQDKMTESIQQNDRGKSGQHGGLRCRARTNPKSAKTNAGCRRHANEDNRQAGNVEKVDNAAAHKQKMPNGNKT